MLDPIERIAPWLVVAVLAVFAVLSFAPRAHAARVGGFIAGDYCDPDDGARSWSRAEKQRTRDRVRAACKSVGGSDLYCSIWDAAVVRESWGGVASAVHTLGTDTDGDREYGLGPMGLSPKYHRDKWPGDDEEPAFCSPEVSFIVAHAIARRAFFVWGARNAVEIQAIYGGGQGTKQCRDRGTPAWVFKMPLLGWLARAAGIAPARRECRVMPLDRHEDAVCRRMGPACLDPLTIEDLGRAVPLRERRAWVHGVSVTAMKTR